MASSSASTSTGGVPPGFRFHPTDEELLLYYLKKKVSSEKFDLEVIREVDLNKIEPWELQERCRVGATPQNEWYFFSHKDRKYPTGSRTNRATNAGFWKATGRDKCIRTSYKKIGMRKTLVFYRGRAPHGQKTDWIMHEYRLEESDEDQNGGNEDGWVVCRVFKKKCFFKMGSGEASSSHGASDALIHLNNVTSLDASRSPYMNQQYQNIPRHNLLPQSNVTSFYKPERRQQLSLLYPNPFNSQIQVQDLLPNHRPEAAAYDFPVQQIDGCVGDQVSREINTNDWAMINDNMENQLSQQQQQQQQRGGEMDLWGYGKD